MDSWHNVANVMYVDQPAGTGLSFTNHNNYADNDSQVPGVEERPHTAVAKGNGLRRLPSQQQQQQQSRVISAFIPFAPPPRIAVPSKPSARTHFWAEIYTYVKRLFDRITSQNVSSLLSRQRC